MKAEAATQLQQRSEYTHKFNVGAGRHGWLRLTPAYSVKAVEEIINRYSNSLCVLDPFCGTGTTALSAISRGHNAATIDINPFLIWLSRAKTAQYAPRLVAEAERAGKAALDLAERQAVEAAAAPEIHNIHRWWSPSSLCFLAHLKSAIHVVSSEAGVVQDLLYLAFCRSLIGLSNAAFNHQSMSFRSTSQCELDLNMTPGTLFHDDLRFILSSARLNPRGAATVIEGDARHLPACLDTPFDLVVTSPPYANRMSYIRELRPYMYWLGYLSKGRDAGELDWRTIGGTWGIATSRLSRWSAKAACWLPERLAPILSKIASGDEVNGMLLANYVAKYCEDMSTHFDSLRKFLRAGARIHYIVGNSTFYGVLVPTEQLYADMLRKYGFEDIRARAIRKRNSKKELVEFDVSAIWPGG